MKKLLIVGAGGLGREILWLAQEINLASPSPTLHCVGFLDTEHQGKLIHGLPILGDEEWAGQHLSCDHHFIIAVGNPTLRKKLAEKMEAMGFYPHSLIHPGISLGPGVKIGAGSILAKGVIPTVDITIAPHCLINLQCTIGHDCQLGAYSVLHPGVHLSGDTQVGTMAEIGTGAVVLPGKSVGECARLGAGAVLTQDLPAHETYAGVPAKPVTKTGTAPK